MGYFSLLCFCSYVSRIPASYCFPSTYHFSNRYVGNAYHHFGYLFSYLVIFHIFSLYDTSIEILVVHWCRSNLKEHMQNCVNRLAEIRSDKEVKAWGLEVGGRMMEEIRRVNHLFLLWFLLFYYFYQMVVFNVI